jgi:hypothetical protein
MQSLRNKTDVPTSVLLLADHLDAVLAAGEDLLKLSVDIAAAARSDGAAAPWERFRGLVGDARLYELTIVNRVLQARKRADEVVKAVAKREPGIKPVLGLFVGGTAVLEDAVAELADRSGGDFDTGLDPLVYMRTRAMIPADAGTITGLTSIGVREDFLVARRIALGPLLDLTAALLDLLDLVYHLFDEDSATRVRGPEPVLDDVVQPLTVQDPTQP